MNVYTVYLASAMNEGNKIKMSITPLNATYVRLQ